MSDDVLRAWQRAVQKQADLGAMPVAAAPQVAPLEAPLAPPPQTATEGAHPSTLSPEEGAFAAPLEAVLAKLQGLLKLKYATMILYTNYGDRLRAHFRDAVHGHFQEHLKEEQRHAYEVAMKMTSFGGEPVPQVGKMPDANDLHQMILNLLRQEQEMQGLERELAQLAGENLGLKALIEQFAADDAHHADDMRRLLACER